MRAVVQRVSRASVCVSDQCIGAIGRGLVVLLGVARDDTAKDADYLVQKISGLRIFDDSNGQMNIGMLELGYELLLISQFTLLGDVRRGKRPSFIDAAQPEIADQLYNYCKDEFCKLGIQVATGQFRADMQVELVNDGPVTILLDSRKVF
jgi:D-aminoacyl-tRNA deacylase